MEAAASLLHSQEFDCIAGEELVELLGVYFNTMKRKSLRVASSSWKFLLDCHVFSLSRINDVQYLIFKQ